MNDEIKEFNEELYVEMLENGELDDYITNLQQQLHQASLDIQELTERDIECPSWCDKLTNLHQENKEWGMIFDTFSSRPYAHRYLEEKRKELGNKRIIGLDSEMIYKDYYDYKSRCEKASDKLSFIDEALESNTLNVPLCIVKINSALNILQNGSENDEC